MPERRGTRLVVEVVFLGALAAALAFAHLDAVEIAGGMFAGWLVVAALEWAAWKNEPHFGSGLPPRYYVPGINLPPPQPLEQVEQGYPGSSREDAPTWIASAALRAEVLGDWPVAAPAPEREDEEEEEEEQLFADGSELDADPWTVAALPAEPLAADEEHEPEPEPDPAAELPVEVEEVLAAAAAEAPSQPARPVFVTASANGRTARYSLDPLGDVAPRRRFGRRAAEPDTATVEVPARTAGPRALPGLAKHA
jgi:hypothetical protein